MDTKEKNYTIIKAYLKGVDFMNQQKIGLFIAKLRKEKNMTQSELAELLHVTDRAISNWETGRRMPDITSLKNLCETFEITFNELLNGEKIDIDDNKKLENTLIETYKMKETSTKKLKRTSKVLIGSIFIIILTVSSIVIYFQRTYPKILSIRNITVSPSSENSLKKYMTIDDRNIWLCGIDSVQLQNDKDFYSLKTALKYNQIKLDQIAEYMETSTDKPSTEKYVVKHSGTIYKNNYYTTIICDTDDNNRDIYFGSLDFEQDLVGAYCGRENTSTFTRTYFIENIKDDDDENYINVTLSHFQGPIKTVRIKRNDTLKKGKSYEFKFRTSTTFEDTIENVFIYSTILEIKETDKVGLEQVNELTFFE